MNIIEAAKAMEEGKRIRRECPVSGLLEWTWPDKSSGNDPRLTIYPMSLDDLLADDWEIVE